MILARACTSSSYGSEAGVGVDQIIDPMRMGTKCMIFVINYVPKSSYRLYGA